ncbi:MAG: aminotransferase class V-fold PLP-dependent enzyme, partial [Acholeplasmataceae bacterium]|nr:aminotransferase class V-fold PLP-dependent enzyme [Acholeplasmataceae bacterium]
MKKIYLDHAATTPIDPLVVESMKPYMTDFFGNPSSMHQLGASNKKAINNARKEVADSIGASFEEIFFCSSGTEASNWAIKGMATKNPLKREIITSKIEHHATLHTC